MISNLFNWKYLFYFIVIYIIISLFTKEEYKKEVKIDKVDPKMKCKLLKDEIERLEEQTNRLREEYDEIKHYDIESRMEELCSRLDGLCVKLENRE